jgi:hypothetical protein
MRCTKPPTVLSMQESGSLPPGVGPAGGISAGGDLIDNGGYASHSRDLKQNVVVGDGGKENGDREI